MSNLFRACVTLVTATFASVAVGAKLVPAAEIAKGSSVIGGAAATSVLGKKLLSTATRLPLTPGLRSLEDENGDDGSSFVAAYSVKFEGCHSISQWNGQNDGGDGAKIITKRVALFRLCPAGSCQDDADGGCSEGYGEYAIDLGTFVEALMDGNEGGGGDGFDPAEYAQCAQYGDDYYVGLLCSEEEGSGVGFGVFIDETCSTLSSGTDFYDLTGYALPYSDGTSLIPDACLSCQDGDGEANGMCQEVYAGSGKCETNMGISYPNENGCDYIAQLKYETSSSTSTGISKGLMTFFVIFGILVVLLGAYVLSLKKKLGRASVSLNEGGGGSMT